MIDQDLHDKISRIVRIHACVCQFPKCAIQHLPVELIVKILNGLSTKEIVLWQGVSRQFRDVIKESTVLQYRIQCCISNVLEEPMNPLRNKAEQMTAMREWSKGWKKAEWKMELTEASALAQGLSLEHPPSITRGVQRKEHDFKDLYKRCPFGFGAHNNVLVVAKPDGHPRKFKLEVLDPVTRQKHSIVENIWTEAMIVDTRGGTLLGSFEITVHGTTAMCFAIYEDHPKGSLYVLEYWWFDLRHGCTYMHLLNDSEGDVKFDSYTLFNERYMVAAINSWDNAMIVVFDRANTERDHCTVEELLRDAVVFLALPPLHENAFYQYFLTESQIERNDLPANYMDAKFTPKNVSPVIHINIPVLHHGTAARCFYELLIPAATIRKHIDQYMAMYGDPDALAPKPWKDWCSDVRLFEGHRATSGVVSGSRYAATEVDPETGKRMVVLYDFCPLDDTLRDFGHGEDVDIQLAPNEIKHQFLKERQVHSAAPYRRVKTRIVLEKDEEPKLTEDSIIIVKDVIGTPLRRTRVYCF